jgi:pimeloyl-ACP methyl ester carboxylesterase
MKRKILLVGFLIILGSFNAIISQQTEKQFTKEIKYLFYLPEDYGKDTIVKWPLILFLHSAGERGDDLSKVKAVGIPKLIENGKKFQFIVVSPLVPYGENWNPDYLNWILRDIMANYEVDEDMIYLTGLSMGGFGTWETAQKYPGIFAAIAPVCGVGDPTQAWKLRHTPVWIFHGAKDPVIPVKNSIIIADSLKQYNNVKLTIFPNAEHNLWAETYDNDELYKWFLEHKRFRFVQTNLKGPKEEYTGLFSSGNDTLTIFQVEDKLWLRYGPGGKHELLLKPSSENTFFLYENIPDEIRYIKDKNGLMSSFTVYTNSRKTFLRVK